MPNPQFLQDLRKSAPGVRMVSRRLSEAWGCEVSLTDSKDFDFCLIVSSTKKVLSIEVKEDFKAAETGNVAIETHFRGKPSGITSSKSDYFVYILGEDVFWIQTSKLKFHVEQFAATNPICVKRGGDNLASILVLVPTDNFKRWVNHLKPVKTTPSFQPTGWLWRKIFKYNGNTQFI